MNAATIARGLQRARKVGAGWIACCPGHEDNNPSLSLGDAGDRVLVHCHGGCSQDAVIAALRDLGLWPESRAKSNVTAVYDYTDEAGKLLYQVCRCEPKKFLQRYPNGTGEWTWKKHPRQVLYHLPEVLENPILFVVEGERDVETLRSYGFVATTNAGGANAPWLPQFTDALRGREVILIPDNDQAGRQRGLRIARALKGQVAKLVALTLDFPGVKDVSDWFAAGHSECELIKLLDAEEVSL